jgi:hypothetical protein
MAEVLARQETHELLDESEQRNQLEILREFTRPEYSPEVVGTPLVQSEAPDVISFHEKVTQRLNSIKKLGNKAVATALAVTGAAASLLGAAPASAVSESRPKPTAQASSLAWTRLGGDPLQANVDTRGELVKLMTSKKGGYAMQLAGLSKKERTAVRREVREDDFYKCETSYGERYDRMAFGNPVRVHKNVKFLDARYRGKGADSWCINVKVPVGKSKIKSIHLEVPFRCGNVSTRENIMVKPKPRKPAKGRPPKKLESGDCAGDTTNTASNNTGQNVQSGNCSKIEQDQTCVANNSPNAVVCSEQNTVVNPPPEQPPQPPEQPPPPPPNAPPIVDLVDLQHNVADRQAEVCAYGSDQNNDIVYQEMTESGDGNFTSNIYAGDEPGEFCRTFAPGTSDGTAVITAKVRDSAGQEASDTESWPIVTREF